MPQSAQMDRRNSVSSPSTSRAPLVLLALLASLLFFESFFASPAASLRRNAPAVKQLCSADARVPAGGVGAPAPPPSAFAPLPSDTRVFDPDVVTHTMAQFGRFLRSQRPERAREFLANEWRDRRHTFPLITGDGFRMLADWWADTKDEVSSMATQLLREDTPLAARLSAGGQAVIVFLGNDDPSLPAFLEGGYLDASPVPIVLLVLNGDKDGIALDNPWLAHPKLAHVFTQNCLGNSSKVTYVPIGLENRQWSMHGWTPETIMGSMLGAREAPSPLERLAATANGTEGTLAFACFGVHTWPEERGPLAGRLDGDRASFGWVSRDCNKGLVDFHRRMLDNAAVIAPRGHGLDTLRAWEALYLGRVIVGRSLPMDPLWEGLPVLLLPSWDALTREAVAAGVAALSTPAALARSRAATPKLFMPYWACEIGKAAGRAGEFCGLPALQAAFEREEGA
jgi:hypothetical protein